MNDILFKKLCLKIVIHIKYYIIPHYQPACPEDPGIFVGM